MTRRLTDEEARRIDEEGARRVVETIRRRHPWAGRELEKKRRREAEWREQERQKPA